MAASHRVSLHRAIFRETEQCGNPVKECLLNKSQFRDQHLVLVRVGGHRFDSRGKQVIDVFPIDPGDADRTGKRPQRRRKQNRHNPFPYTVRSCAEQRSQTHQWLGVFSRDGQEVSQVLPDITQPGIRQLLGRGITPYRAAVFPSTVGSIQTGHEQHRPEHRHVGPIPFQPQVLST